jgi:hypothetical protein
MHEALFLVCALSAYSTAELTFGVAGAAGVVLGPPPGGLNTPNGMAALTNGEVLVVDSVEHALLVVHP